MDNFLYWGKKYITSAVYPVPVVLFFLLLGFWFWVRGRRMFLAPLFLLLGVFWLSLWSFPYFPNHLLRGLESQYSRLGGRQQILARFGDIDSSVPFIVVLGGGANNDEDPSVSELGKLPDSAFRRVLESVRIHSYFPQTKVIMSGSPLEADVMTRVAIVLGISPEDILKESQSRDTEDEARYVKVMVKGDKFFLITSAWHMPRSAGLFHKQGLNFIACPTDFLGVPESKQYLTILNWVFPDAGNLQKGQVAIKEYLGIMAERFLGKI